MTNSTAGQPQDTRPVRLTRRRVLAGLGATAVAVTGGGWAMARSRQLPGTSEAHPGLRSWDDPQAWASGVVPAASGLGVVRGDVMLDRDAQVGGLRIPAGSSLTFAAARDVTLTSAGSVVVEGALHLAPERASVRHTLRFTGVDEERTTGGGLDVVVADTGLWVNGAGLLELRGARRLAWTRLAGDGMAGASTLDLVEEPVGWRAGDDVVVVPSAPPSAASDHQAFDVARVAGVDGRSITLDRPLRHSHPAADLPAGPLGAEILNLTRNVVVAGTPSGRTHVHLGTDRPPVLEYARIEHAGPQREQGFVDRSGRPAPTPVLGRYGLHFHHCGEATRGLDVTGVVVTHCGNHAFVAHSSHGIRFRDCVAHDTALSAFWWDAAGGTDATDDTRYERCVASLTHGFDLDLDAATAALVRRVAGFELLRGRGNTAVECVSVGVQAGQDSAGFLWPEDAEGEWSVRSCVSHNHRQHGSYVWQNTAQPHRVERLVAYHNAVHGFVHGAYSNNYTYEGCVAYGNGGAALLRQANSAGPEPRQAWHGCQFDAAGQGPYAVQNGPHGYPPTREAGDVLFEDCTLQGGTVAAVGLVDAEDIRSWCALDFVDCRFGEPAFDVRAAYEATRWRVQSDGEAVEYRWATGAGARSVPPFTEPDA